MGRAARCQPEVGTRHLPGEGGTDTGGPQGLPWHGVMARPWGDLSGQSHQGVAQGGSDGQGVAASPGVRAAPAVPAGTASLRRSAASARAASSAPSPTGSEPCPATCSWMRPAWASTSASSATWPTRSYPARWTGAGTSTSTACARPPSSWQPSPSLRCGARRRGRELPGLSLAQACMCPWGARIGGGRTRLWCPGARGGARTWGGRGG